MSNTFNKIVLIGAGKVATQLALNLIAQGKQILQVYSRTMKSAEKLAKSIHSQAIDQLIDVSMDAELIIIAVADDAIAVVAQGLKRPNQTFVHTSGSVPMEAISGISPKHGVFYPLQTFSDIKNISFQTIPICIEAASPELTEKLINFARELSGDVRKVSSEQRLQIHIAAVFANNFSNFMYLMSEEVLAAAGVPFNIIQSLIKETAEKIMTTLPHQAQTGPAARLDKKVIARHLEELKQYPEMHDLYKDISDRIIKHFHQNK